MIKLNIKEIRKSKGLSQEQLSRNLDMSLNHVQLIENKKTKGIPYETLEKICSVLDCEPGDLLKLEKN